MDKFYKQFTLRLSLIYIMIIIIFIVIICKVVYLETAERSFWVDLAKERNVELRTVQAKRGNIYAIDSDNSEKLLLATNLTYYDLYIDLGKGNVKEKGNRNSVPQWVVPDSTYNKGISNLCIQLANLFPSKTANDYKKYFDSQRKKQNRFVLIQKGINEVQLNKMKTMPIIGTSITKKRQGKITTIYSFVGAVRVIEKDKRIYPYGDMARRTIGIAVTERGCDTCFDGIDGFYSQYLRGKHGRRLERRINPNQWVPVDDDQEIKAIAGNDIVTTIDVSLQELAESSLLHCLDSNKAESGTVILMETSTGYIKALANFTKQKDGSYYESENVGVSDLLEPGSTFKIVTSMMMLDKGLVDTSVLVPTGKRNYPGATKPIRDVKEIDHGWIPFCRALEISSNVGISYLADSLYCKKNSPRRGLLYSDLQEYFNYNRISYDLNIYEPKPIIRSTRQIDDVLRMSFGYLTMMTPLQLLTFYNGIANNGKVMKPIFVSQVLKDGNVIKEFEPIVLKQQMCKPQTLSKIQAVLKRVVLYGTGKRLRGTSYGIAGKTGTAEIGYDNKKNILQHRASFVGYFPSDEPKYSCIVVISKPQKALTHGGELAAPVFRELSDRVIGTRLTYRPKNTTYAYQYPILSYGFAQNYTLFCHSLGFALPHFSSNWVKCNNTDSVFHCSYAKIKSNIMPNVKGLTIRDAIYLLENMGLRVSFTGYGKVESQSIEAGTNIKKNSSVTLTLSSEEKNQSNNLLEQRDSEEKQSNNLKKQ
jgi:cell division protein FtsI (penicillin-binding protein 3)